MGDGNTTLSRELKKRIVDGKDWYHAKYQSVSTKDLLIKLCNNYNRLIKKENDQLHD